MGGIGMYKNLPNFFPPVKGTNSTAGLDPVLGRIYETHQCHRDKKELIEIDRIKN
jgi:hypothetical protein